MHAHSLRSTRIEKGFGITAAASQHFNVYGHGCLITMVFLNTEV